MCNLELSREPRNCFSFQCKNNANLCTFMSFYTYFCFISVDFRSCLSTSSDLQFTIQTIRALLILLDSAFYFNVLFWTKDREALGEHHRLLWLCDFCWLMTTSDELASSTRRSFQCLSSFHESSWRGEQVLQQETQECFCQESWSAASSAPS